MSNSDVDESARVNFVPRVSNNSPPVFVTARHPLFSDAITFRVTMTAESTVVKRRISTVSCSSLWIRRTCDYIINACNFVLFSSSVRVMVRVRVMVIFSV